MHENNVPFINDGEPIKAAEISTLLSLTLIVGILLITIVVSLVSPRGRAETYLAAARRRASEFLEIETDPTYCDAMYHKLLIEEDHVNQLPERYRLRVQDELTTLLDRAHEVHEERVAAGRCFAQAPAGARD
jgi:tellurite resistance protein TerC